MKKITYIIISSFFVNALSSIAMAQESVLSTINIEPLEQVQLEPPNLSTGEFGELQTYLNLNELAPWPGVLLNPAAVAFIVSEYEASYERARLALQRQWSLDSNRLRLEVSSLRLTLESERAIHRLELESRDKEISRLQHIHQDLIDNQTSSFWEDVLKIGGGLIVGVGAGIIVGLSLAN